MLYLRDEQWPCVEPAVAGSIAVLAPAVTKFDDRGKALTELAMVSIEKKGAIDVLPRAKWVELETSCPKEKCQGYVGNGGSAASPPLHGKSACHCSDKDRNSFRNADEGNDY